MSLHTKDAGGPPERLLPSRSRTIPALFLLLVHLGLPQAIAAQPKTFEVRYDENGEISHFVGPDEAARVVRPSDKIRTVTASEVPDILKQQLGEATLLVIWTAADKECLTLMRRITELSKQFQANGLSIVTLSVDSDASRFRRYARRMKSSVETIRVGDYVKGTLDDELEKLGIKLKGFSVPIYAWFDKEGKVVKAGSDAPSYDDLASTAKELMKYAPPAR